MPTNTLQTLDRGLRAINIISERPEGISVIELAAELDVHRAICYRIVATLEANAFVTRTESGRVRLGAGVAALSFRFEPQLRHAARPILITLANEMHATAHLTIVQGEQCVVVMAIEPDAAVLRVGYNVGSRHPITEGAAGLAILAMRPPHPADLPEVQQAREVGYGLTAGRLGAGAIDIAAGVPRSTSVVHASGVEASIGIVAMNGLDTEAAARQVLKAAREIAALALS